jgi:hypothetical protein
MLFGTGMVLLAFNTTDDRGWGFLTPSTEAPTQLLPVLDIASTSPFRPCFKLMSCRVLPTSSESSLPMLQPRYVVLGARAVLSYIHAANLTAVLVVSIDWPTRVN